ncbi:P63C domain-containing protein [Pedobacter insulae]|uniref:P63C domain-containing protein n=1 Tax=Pedobacter insulae TaxID=414048 RepID=A0A1I2WY99_9SPHI|nr:P63C domain-containing protein [Pedobacter insulae]SFH05609.1 P63C domain-containing protein [Pedobacter insulae]
MEDNLKNVQQDADKIELKKLREKDEQGMLFFNTEALLPRPSLKQDLEKHQLQNGLEFTIREVKDLISDMARDYEPMFPNRIPFFKLMYQLLKWDNLNPNSFIKPPVVAIYIKKYIYARFDKDILPTLLKKDNPFVNGYIKKFKLFQFLNDDGLLLLESYIKEAIEVMKDSNDWYDFELKYTAKYKLSVQLKIVASN